jgi:hypothetical protein
VEAQRRILKAEATVDQMMREKICYLGDNRLDAAAGYLAGIMSHHGWAFDHIPSHEKPAADFCHAKYALYVVRDYPAAQFGATAIRLVADRVAQGSGLIMLGGWESCFGRLGEYHESPLAEVLPVVMQRCDDRRNVAQPCLINQVAEHPILADLPWDEPPGIGGFSMLSAKPAAETVLTSVQFSVRRRGGSQLTRAGAAVTP